MDFILHGPGYLRRKFVLLDARGRSYTFLCTSPATQALLWVSQYRNVKAQSHCSDDSFPLVRSPLHRTSYRARL
jgi:hypothetical protein